MADEKTLMVVGSASIVGAILAALGNAVGFTRRIKKVEDAVEKLQTCKGTYLTKSDHDRQCNASKELTEEKLGRMEDKLDMILDRINHCRYQGGVE